MIDDSKNQLEDQSLRDRFRKVCAVGMAKNGTMIAVFDSGAEQAAQFAAELCAREEDPSIQVAEKDRFSVFTMNHDLPALRFTGVNGTVVTCPCVEINPRSKAFAFLQRRVAEQKVEGLQHCVDSDAFMDEAQDMFGYQQQAKSLIDAHAVLVATAKDSPYAYVVFGEHADQQAAELALYARKLAPDAPTFEGKRAEIVEPLDIEDTHFKAHRQWGFYMAKDSPEFRRLQHLMVDKGLPHVECEGDDIDPALVRPVLESRVRQRPDFELREIYRHAVLCATVQDHGYAWVVFDRDRYHEAQRARDQSQQQVMKQDSHAKWDPKLALAMTVMVPMGNKNAEYPCIAIRTNSDAFRFLDAPQVKGKPTHSVTRLHSDISGDDMSAQVDNKMKLHAQVESEIRVTSRYN